MKSKSIITLITFFVSASSTIIIPSTLLYVQVKDINNLNKPTTPPTTDPNKPIIPPTTDNEKPTNPSPNPDPNKPIEPPTTDPNKPNVPDLPSNIDTTYFKHSAKLINNLGQYSMATPGNGTGNSSIHPSNGPSRTAPSKGIQENAPVNKKYLYSDNDIKQAKRTVSLLFSNGGPHMGTGWILDYKLTENGSYPLTWYFGTNAHVIQNLKVKGDILTPERYAEGDYNTSGLIIRGIKNPTKNKEYSNSFDDNNSFNWINVVPKYDENKKISSNLKTVFIGNDYLKTSPSMFSNDSRWKNSEEYIDFAVLEVTFENESDARTATNNYAELETKEQFKYKTQSLLNEKSSPTPNSYKVLGFPETNRNGSSTNQGIIQMFTSLPESPNKTEKENGTSLGNSVFYNTFENKEGVFDAALALSFFGYNYRLTGDKTKFYNSWGLAYPVNYGNLGPGSSGSMLMDKDGYTVGIHFAADDRASMGLAQALYCEGFSYNGQYGSYNLEGYDLIQGGFPNQKKSYLSGLKELYEKESSFKTNLFPNGLNGGIRSFT